MTFCKIPSEQTPEFKAERVTYSSQAGSVATATQKSKFTSGLKTLNTSDTHSNPNRNHATEKFAKMREEKREINYIAEHK